MLPQVPSHLARRRCSGPLPHAPARRSPPPAGPPRLRPRPLARGIARRQPLRIDRHRRHVSDTRVRVAAGPRRVVAEPRTEGTIQSRRRRSNRYRRSQTAWFSSRASPCPWCSSPVPVPHLALPWSEVPCLRHSETQEEGADSVGSRLPLTLCRATALPSDAPRLPRTAGRRDPPSRRAVRRVPSATCHRRPNRNSAAARPLLSAEGMIQTRRVARLRRRRPVRPARHPRGSAESVSALG